MSGRRGGVQAGGGGEQASAFQLSLSCVQVPDVEDSLPAHTVPCLPLAPAPLTPPHCPGNLGIDG